MGALSHQAIRSLLNGSTPLLSGYRDVEQQLQPNGFDMTLQSVERFQSDAHLATDNAERRLPDTQETAFDASGVVHLDPGPYLITLNEVVNLPLDLMALGKPRSSLLRSGVSIHNAVWDAGYHGRSQALLMVYNPHGFSVAQNARVLQLVFLTLDAATSVPYDGIFQGENLSI
jgi:dUTP pyrophosphatase